MNFLKKEMDKTITIQEHLENELTFYYAAAILRALNVDYPEIHTGIKKVKIFVSPHVYKMFKRHENMNIYSDNYVFIADEDLKYDHFKFTKTKDLIIDVDNFFD